MKFCPECELKLKRVDSVFQCYKCGYVEGTTTDAVPKKITNDTPEPSFNVFEGNEGNETHPTIKIDCEKCGHDEAIWWMLQTRSADEPTTQFYRCVKCSYTWRNYA